MWGVHRPAGLVTLPARPVTASVASRTARWMGISEAPPKPFRVGGYGRHAHARGKPQHGLYLRSGTVNRPVHQVRYTRADAYLRPVRRDLRRPRRLGGIGYRSGLQHRVCIA